MSHKSRNRDLYLARARYCTNTASEFIEMMEKSPYAMHKRVAPSLRAQINTMSAQAIERLKKQEESNAFAERLKI